MYSEAYKKLRRLSPYIRRGIGRYSLLKSEMIKKGFIFVHIPKAAGTSISEALGIVDPGHYCLKEYKSKLGEDFDGFYKFAVVRDPWDRVASSFFYAQRHVAKYPYSSVAFVAEYANFSDFVKCWISKGNIEKHYFFKTCYDYVVVEGQVAVDDVVKFEALHEDFICVAESLSISSDLPHKNSNGLKDYRELYDEEMRNIVAIAYADDLKAFGYEFER